MKSLTMQTQREKYLVVEIVAKNLIKVDIIKSSHYVKKIRKTIERVELVLVSKRVTIPSRIQLYNMPECDYLRAYNII